MKALGSTWRVQESVCEEGPEAQPVQKVVCSDKTLLHSTRSWISQGPRGYPSWPFYLVEGTLLLLSLIVLGQQAVLGGVGGYLRAAAQVQLVQDVAEVVADGVLADN
jgi:hypothetical protein